MKFIEYHHLMQVLNIINQILLTLVVWVFFAFLSLPWSWYEHFYCVTLVLRPENCY